MKLFVCVSIFNFAHQSHVFVHWRSDSHLAGDLLGFGVHDGSHLPSVPAKARQPRYFPAKPILSKTNPFLFRPNPALVVPICFYESFLKEAFSVCSVLWHIMTRRGLFVPIIIIFFKWKNCSEIKRIIVLFFWQLHHCQCVGTKKIVASRGWTSA